MEHIDVDKLAAGPYMDQLVAEMIFGAYVRQNDKGRWDKIIPGQRYLVDYVNREDAERAAHAYSTDDTLVWEIAEKMNECGWHVLISMGVSGAKWCVLTSDNNMDSVSGFGNNLAYIVCKTALKAILCE